jgi:hypothetical protein
MRTRLVYSVIAIALGVGLFTAPTSFACGPFQLEAIFTFTVHPEFPLERFARGQLGVVQPSYARSYLFVAYRQLLGNGFNEQEQRVLTQFWHDRLDYNWDLGDQEWIKEWIAARQMVPGVGEPPKIEVYRHREKPDEYETYLNCQKDAFESASTTLAARISKYGIENRAVKDWIAAQDQVFANCSEGQHIPAAAVASEETLFQADRTYQIAAANFYAGNFDEARRTFESIAADGASPWQHFAPYLIARTLVRKASLGAAEVKEPALSDAEGQLNKILADQKFNQSHAAAGRLLSVVRIRLHPKERLHELAHSLLDRNQNDALKQQLWDYTSLLDEFLGTDESDNRTKPTVDLRGDDLTDWIATFESPASEALDHSLARWQATHAATWLIASLSKVDGKNGKTAELISQAMSIKPGTPAFASTRFHIVRLLLESGKIDDARSMLDELLAQNRSRFDKSSLNLLLGKRMLLARNLADFLTFAPRVPAGFSWNDDGREVPAEASELSEENKALQGKLLFDEDATHLLNQEFPLVLLKEAAKSNALPPHLRRDVAQAAWLRAVLLGDNKTADELVPILKTLVPELSSNLDDFLSSPQADSKRFAAIYAWLKFPGLEPAVDSGVGRETPLRQQDIYRDNWWCAAAFSPVPDAADDEKNKPRSFAATSKTGVPSFLRETETAVAAREHSTLSSLGAAPNYLCQQVIQWATKNPNDPRVPEALHLAVNTTRHGCTDKETGRWSKAAFDLLRRKYPNTTWAKKTPYWFKD